jgi:hypothetical protein
MMLVAATRMPEVRFSSVSWYHHFHLFSFITDKDGFINASASNKQLPSATD